MDKMNRQNMEHMRQYGGDPYGGQQQYPYGMPPMMMGMPPMGYGVSCDTPALGNELAWC